MKYPVIQLFSGTQLPSTVVLTEVFLGAAVCSVFPVIPHLCGRCSEKET
jgi:hypothetical protein